MSNPNRKLLITVFIFFELFCLIKGEEDECCVALEIFKEKYFTEMISSEKKIKDLETENKELKEKIEELIKKEEERKRETPADIDTEIISNMIEKELLTDRLKQIDYFKNSTVELKLLYRGTRDGLNCPDLHEKCDGIPRTISIVKSDSGARFGGYMTNSYSKNFFDWVNDDFDSFVFSIDLMKIYNATKIANQKYHIGYYSGPHFWAFYVDDDSGESPSDYKPFGESLQYIYFDPSEHFSGLANDKYELNLGYKYFYVKEIEIFQVVKKE